MRYGLAICAFSSKVTNEMLSASETEGRNKKIMRDWRVRVLELCWRVGG